MGWNATKKMSNFQRILLLHTRSYCYFRHLSLKVIAGKFPTNHQTKGDAFRAKGSGESMTMCHQCTGMLMTHRDWLITCFWISSLRLIVRLMSKSKCQWCSQWLMLTLIWWCCAWLEPIHRRRYRWECLLCSTGFRMSPRPTSHGGSTKTQSLLPVLLGPPETCLISNLHSLLKHLWITAAWSRPVSECYRILISTTLR